MLDNKNLEELLQNVWFHIIQFFNNLITNKPCNNSQSQAGFIL